MPSVFYINALAIPKVLYILRTSPCFLLPALHDFDSLLRSLLGSILNVNPSDSAWTQASLPVRAGGLGVRSTTQLAPSAYLFSIGCGLCTACPADLAPKTAELPIPSSHRGIGCLATGPQRTSSMCP